MSEQQAIKEIRQLFAECGIECSEDEARSLVAIGMRARIAVLARRAIFASQCAS